MVTKGVFLYKHCEADRLITCIKPRENYLWSSWYKNLGFKEEVRTSKQKTKKKKRGNLLKSNILKAYRHFDLDK